DYGFTGSSNRNQGSRGNAAGYRRIDSFPDVVNGSSVARIRCISFVVVESSASETWLAQLRSDRKDSTAENAFSERRHESWAMRFCPNFRSRSARVAKIIATASSVRRN